MKLLLKGILVTSLLIAFWGIGSILGKTYSFESFMYLIAFSGIGNTFYAQTFMNSKFARMLKGTLKK